MRRSILLPLLLSLTAGCSGDGGTDSYTIISDFADRATPTLCRPADLGDVAIQELRSATDTSFLVLDAAQRRVTEFSDGLRPLWSLEYDEFGPAAVNRPESATLVGDTAVAIVTADIRLVVLGRDGRLIHALPLDFAPNKVAASGDDVWITAIPMGATPGSLLFRFRDGALERLDVPPRHYDDMLVGSLGNRATVVTLSDGAGLVMHEMLAPGAFRVSSSDPATVAQVAVPTPDATADHIDFVPVAPVTADQAADALIPAIALSTDPSRGRVYILTRSGRQVGDREERALIQTDETLAFQAAYTLDVNAINLAILPRRRAALVSDDLDRVYLCPLDDHADADTE